MKCWASVADGGSALRQFWDDAPLFAGMSCIYLCVCLRYFWSHNLLIIYNNIISSLYIYIILKNICSHVIRKACYSKSGQRIYLLCRSRSRWVHGHETTHVQCFPKLADWSRVCMKKCVDFILSKKCNYINMPTKEESICQHTRKICISFVLRRWANIVQMLYKCCVYRTFLCVSLQAVSMKIMVKLIWRFAMLLNLI